LRGQNHHIKPGRVPAGRAELQKKEFIDTLIKAGGNQSEAARLLGVSRVTVWTWIKKFRIDVRREVRA
jgi:transcriptional regulator of acetoin/glycerol metabolism